MHPPEQTNFITDASGYKCQQRTYESYKYKSRSIAVRAQTSPQFNEIEPHNSDDIRHYYINPKKMSIKQLKYFKKHAKYRNMTKDDYVNWLMLFTDNDFPNNKEYNTSMRFNLLNNKLLLKEDIPDDSNARSLIAIKENISIDKLLPVITH